MSAQQYQTRLLESLHSPGEAELAVWQDDNALIPAHHPSQAAVAPPAVHRN